MDDPESQDLTKSQTETLPAQSEPSSVSTAGLLSSQPASTVAKEKDGSVISAVTDPASVEGPLLPAMEEEDDGSGSDVFVPVDPDVPEHVILDERPDSLIDSPNATPSDSPAVPDRKIPPPPETEPDEEQKVVNGETETTPTKDAESERQRNIEKEHDFSQSPAVSSEIVERSPGGRYVRFLEKLGSGASKDVYKAYDTEEGIEVAWNVVSLAGVPKSERNRLVNEVRLLERLHHQNIISFHGSWVNREKQEVIFVTEILSSGTLKKFINKVQVIRWKIAKRWAVQILKGLEYLHSQDPPVIHRDLKCENIFINGPSGDLRIGDLGLSTVHQNGKMLSVLGTPEFMAPDMYDDKPYDKKVDVYAFGMCLLEIFTQEIPYSECNNPAQIYKKVSNGESPEVLSRLQSKHARDFVNLCLGYKDDEGNYVRPTVSELLKHPFLLKRENDDDEVVVEKPLRERTIPEVAEGSVATPKVKRKVKQDPEKARTSDGSTEMPKKRSPSIASSDDNGEEADKFEEMPQSETNMRKVKVMMGRNEELKEDDGGEDSVEKSATAEAESATSASSPSSPQNYLVAAAVIENENPHVLQFADGVLKLVITLPVKGENLNVQFDFHLVDDNPFQVAKEMVQELKIPETAIIEISETISRLAQQARIQLRAQQGGPAAGNVQHHPIVSGQHDQSQFHPQQAAQGPHVVQGPSGSQNVTQQDPGNMQQNQQGLYRPVVHNDISKADQMFQQQGVAASVQHPGLYPIAGSGSAQGPSHSGQGVNHPNPLPGSSVQQGQHFQHQGAQQAPSFQVLGNAQFAHQGQNLSSEQAATAPSNFAQQGGAGTFPVQMHQIANDPSQLNPAVHQDNFQHHPHSNAPSHQLPGHVRTVSSASPITTTGQNFHQSNVGAPAIPVHDNRQTVDGQNNFPQPPHHQLVQPAAVAPQRTMPPPPPSSIAAQTQTPSSSLPPPAPGRPDFGVRRQSESNESIVPSDLAPLSPKTAGHAESSATLSLQGASPDSSIIETSGGTVDSEDDDDDDDVREELRKLEEDFQKNIQRAKKVYDNRMDNLQRSQYEKEAQHQKTLEKHQKERAEYEKRLAEEEKQQNRRIEQLQKELTKRKQTVAKQKRKQRNGFHGVAGEVPHETSFMLPHEAEVSHVRSLSSSSTNPPSSPATSAHKVPPESNAGGGPPPAER